jgi:coenzyme F420 hydrogenase subunit beta
MEAGKGSADLEREVLGQGLCTSCGACVNICPYIEVVRDKVAVIEPCGLTEGKCYDLCPRTSTDIAALDKFVFGRMRSDYSLGPYVSIEMAQAADSEIRRRAQYGGVVSALMKYALDTGEISNAVLTKPFDAALMPTSVVAQEGNQLLECAGSNYISSATLARMNEATKQGRDSIGLVGIPCQVLALRKMQAAKHETGANGVKLVIGLFCTWALSYKGFYEFLKDKVDPSLVMRIDIPPPPANIMVLETAGGDARFSLDEVREFIKPTCSVCYDMTSEFADISVGMVEGIEDWNTLIVRTPVGKRLVDEATRAGVVNTRPLEQTRLDHLKEASSLKKKRAVDAIQKRTNDRSNLLYLRLRAQEKKRYL